MNSNKFAEQLDEINKVYKERAPQHTSSEKENGDPNIFEILGIENKEVLICRILGDLLNPNGKINSGNSDPLKLFLSQVLNINHVCAEKDFEHAEIVLEEVTDENRRVDIVIKIGREKDIYPLEVKINAVDQPAQLYDYYHFYFGDTTQQSDKKIYYLTPTGKEPSSDSIKTLNRENYKSISFDIDILSWLHSLLDSCKFNDTARFIIKQFEEVIQKMTLDLKKRDALYESLGYTKKDGFKYSELLLSILNHHDEIKALIQQNYIYNNCDLKAEPYTLSDNIEKEDKKKDTHCLLKVLDKSQNTIAWICVATYLYIATDNEKVKESTNFKWETETTKTGTYYWRYLFLKGEEEKLRLSNPANCLNKEGEIAIKDILKDCE